MNLRNLLVAGFMAALMPFVANAQDQRNCGTMQHLEEQQALDPSLKNQMHEIERQTRLIIEKQGNQKTGMVTTIPVVFHVLYNTSTLNIPDARILAQLDVLNKDFARLNADASNTPSIFQSVAANTNIQFCLAQRDPNGNPTNGILRVPTTVSSFSSNNAMKFTSQGGSNAWNTSQYLNIWVCNLGGGLLGYAQFPGGSASTDGVVVLTGSVGGPSSPGTSTPYHLGRTATHEVGHWLALRHIWGDATCGTDSVPDTPVHNTSNGGCPTYPHYSTCSGNPIEMTMNYMDYTNDECMNMFTAGQSSRMNAAITAFRPGLLTSLGCVPPNISCGTPTGVIASGVTSSSASISWSAVSGATSYNVQYRIAGSGAAWSSTSSTTTGVALSGLAASTQYEVQVQAVCGTNTGSFSASTLFTTTATGTTCGTPSGLSANSVTTSSATLNWVAVSGASSYNVQYRPNSTTVWTTTTSATTSVNISGLTAATQYTYQVQAVCSGTPGTYSTTATFTTQSATTCNDPYESNNTSGTAKILTTSQLNTNLTATISSTTDVDWYRFSTISGATRVKVNLTTLPADYDVYLYSNNASTVLGSGTLTGTSSEQIIRNATKAATYYIRVIGYQGVFSTSSCYTLRISTSGTNWRIDDGNAVAVEPIDQSTVLVMPNPTSSKSTFEFVSDVNGTAKIMIADMLGKMVYANDAFEVTEGVNSFSNDFSNVSKGMHFVIVEINGERKTARFVVE
ncbi:MAG: fibronectin type III domain-containing protein [Bacteroidota bacterium]